MRHRKKGRKLKRTASHRRATLASLATSLLRHKRIMTTVAKAKETRMVVEKLITRARHAAAYNAGDARAVHERRQVGRLIKDRGVVAELFGSIAEKIGTRPGGYTRIVKLGQRQGDGAEMAVIELVDFNTGQELADKKTPEKKVKKKEAGPKKKKDAGEKAVESETQNAGETAPEADSKKKSKAKESR
jgi:large subunit ribosomal protein L17